MLSAFCRALCVVVVLGAGTSLWAGPRILPPGDREGAEVRSAAVQFLDSLADGEAAGARKVFAGPDADARLLEVYVELGKAGLALEKAADARLGEGAPKLVRENNILRAGAAQMSKRFVVVDGGDASIAGIEFLPGLDLIIGLDLHREGDEWKVVHLTSHGAQREWAARAAANWAEIMDRTREQIDAGKFASGEAARDSMARAFDKAWMQFSPPPQKACTEPSTRPAATVESLQRMMGSEAISAEVSELLTRWDSLPVLAQEPGTLKMIGLESGLVLIFEGRPLVLVSAILLKQNALGSAGYRGDVFRGLTLSSRRREAEEKLGRPALAWGTRIVRYAARYPALGLWINYSEPPTAGGDNLVREFRVMKPDPRGEPPSTMPADGPHMEFRLVVDAAEDADRFADPEKAGDHILVSRRAVLDASAIAEVTLARDGVGLMMTEDGAKRLAQISSANHGRRMAIVLNGQIVAAPTIRGELRDRVIVTATGGQEITLTERMSAVVYALPATRPSK